MDDHHRLASLTTRLGILDHLLAEIVIALQLTDAQIARMESAYRALAAWLDHPDSPLAVYRPQPQPRAVGALPPASNEWPQAQEATALGLRTVKPPISV